MKTQNKVKIYEILDMFNEEVGYKGLNNAGKTTNERDDVITRQTFNNWLKEYNNSHERKIKSRAIDQYVNEWHKSDIEKLIKDKKVQKKLRDSYLRNTVPLFEDWESIGLAFEQRVSKKYMAHRVELKSKDHRESLALAIQEIINQLVNEVINQHFSLIYRDEFLEVNKFVDKIKITEEFIDMNRIKEEAFRIIDNVYGIPEYDYNGNIVHVHHSANRKESNYFLK
ncbi:hypothetical protein EVJ30_10610 [Exiguobacterium sp. SH5S13]|uniref:hypothetical protein n=1 Tax=Exiguobacterium sp. SH5S13 TaxID=2510959 RepID=UPI00103D0AC4|nr:hypothetical protein [Exiguobacterium sp. SH5S13]TCI52068.1 hypothetical protein EVJ30_10610 [Exiguobacterium sp. SH5S13]